ncbi:phage holin, LLH family [Aerococcus urinae]|uniref:phage holin, LLH family n=1 Tax=Aerococcus urinae TaxID=1376 RepID=UPI0025510CA2|nr:phage holin, LLH family [Aerococcus urinae]MDK6688340.1 phage holin, LLH family [Aerococcus urinae]
MFDILDGYVVSVIARAVLTIVGVFVAVLAQQVAGYAKAYYQANTTREQQKVINQVIQDAVAYAEQQGWDKIGKEKFDIAKKRAEWLLAEKGIKVDFQELQTAIESAVLSLNNSKGDK